MHYEKTNNIMIIKQREDELYSNWSEETNEDWTQEWRDELTEDEQKLVHKWDSGYCNGILKISDYFICRCGWCHPALSYCYDKNCNSYSKCDTCENKGKPCCESCQYKKQIKE